MHWSVANETALAEAELEYHDREDVSVYVDFEAADPGAVYDAVLKAGVPYRGEAMILGEKYFTAYDPIKDSSGKTVQTQELGEQAAGQFFFAWDGKDVEGNVLKDGMYTFSVKAATLTGTEVKATTSQIGTVSAVTRTSSGFVLDMGDLGDVAFQDVQKIL